MLRWIGKDAKDGPPATHGELTASDILSITQQGKQKKYGQSHEFAETAVISPQSPLPHFCSCHTPYKVLFQNHHCCIRRQRSGFLSEMGIYRQLRSANRLRIQLRRKLACVDMH
jgi:hypothetical protein